MTVTSRDKIYEEPAFVYQSVKSKIVYKIIKNVKW